MTTTEAAELAMHIDRVGERHGIRVVDGSGFEGPIGVCFAVEMPDGSRRLITDETDWRAIVSDARAR